MGGVVGSRNNAKTHITYVYLEHIPGVDEAPAVLCVIREDMTFILAAPS